MKRIFLLLIITVLISTNIITAGQNTPAGAGEDANSKKPADANKPKPTAGAKKEDKKDGKKDENKPKTIPSDPSSLKHNMYREIKLNTDFTLKFVNKLKTDKLEDAASFINVTYKDKDKIKSVAAYARDKKITLFVLDNKLNMFFYYITYEYSDDIVNSFILRDPTDQKLWQVKFEYDDKKNITKNEIWKRETVSGELKLLFYNTYQYYAQGKMFVHTRYDNNKEMEEKTYYTPQGLKKRYERYKGNGKLQYYTVYFYQNGKEIRKEVYSASDVLLEIIAGKQS